MHADASPSSSSAAFIDADTSSSDIAPQFCPFNVIQPDASLSGNCDQHGLFSPGFSAPGISAENPETFSAQHAFHAHGLFVGEPVVQPFGHEGATKKHSRDDAPRPLKL